MKGNPAMPGGLLTSKPTRSNTLKYLTASAFFVSQALGTVATTGQDKRMDRARRITARQNTQQAAKLASENRDKLLPLATFKNSLREWQARWRARCAKLAATTNKEPGGAEPA
jgi:hypothetical protein